MKQDKSKDLVSKIKVHENGLQYKEIEFNEGIVVKLFNTNKPQRLKEESQLEYKIRRKLNNNQLKEFLKGELFYNSSNGIPYVNEDKQLNKFNSKKSITK